MLCNWCSFVYYNDGSSSQWVLSSPAGSGGATSVSVAETAPSTAEVGDMWFDPSVLKTFVYFNDGDGPQWVQSNPGMAASGGVSISLTSPTNPRIGDLWMDPDVLKTFVYYNDGDSSQWIRLLPQ